MNTATQLSRSHVMLLRLAFDCRGAGARMSDRREGERGAVMTEYGLLLMVALIAAFAVLALFGNSVVGLFERAYADFVNAYDPAEAPA